MSGEIAIAASDRVSFVGQTGYGKSWAAMVLLTMQPPQPRLVFCDVKDKLPDTPDGWPPQWGLLPKEQAEQGLRLLEAGKPARVWLPARPRAEWDPIFRRLFRLRGVYIYLDEVIGAGPKQGSEGLDLLLAQGRAHGISMWCAMQRPANVDPLILTQSDWIFGFRLQGADDQDRVARIMGLRRYPRLQKFEFLVYNPAWDAPIRRRLEL